jgi:hypothetical protein
MPVNASACLRLDRVPIRPISQLLRPNLACGRLGVLDDARAGRPGGGPRPAVELHDKTNGVGSSERTLARSSSASRKGATHSANGPNRRGKRRRSTPMSARGPDPPRAHCGPLGLIVLH